MFSRDARARVLPFATYMAFIALGDLLARVGYSAVELRWLYAVRIFAVVVVLVIFSPFAELKPFRITVRDALISIGVGVVVWYLWINLNASWMVLGQSAGFDPRNDGQLDLMLVAVRLFGAALVVPVMEELFWRSFLMRWIQSQDFLAVDPRQVKVFGMLVAMALFGIEHNLWFAGVVAGAAYSLLYMYSRNLWSAVLAHAVTNGLLGCWIIMTSQWTYW